MKKFAKWLVMILVVSCICALTLFATGCGEKAKSVKSINVNDKGEIVAVYDDDSVATLGNVGFVKSAEVKGDKFVLTLSDGKTIEVPVASTTVTKSVVAIEKDGNVLKITYSDKTTGEIKLGEDSVACDHKNAHYVEEVAHAMKADKTFTNGVYLMLCPDCGYAYTYVGVRHVYETTVVEPTCMEKGYTAEKCTVCGYEAEIKDEKPALGHVWEAAPVLDEHNLKSWCENGGWTVQMCTRCHAVGEESYWLDAKDAKGHVSETWTVSEKPEYNKVGTLSGVCKVCGQTVTKSIPACKDAAYTVSDVTPADGSCGEAKKGTFTITVDGQEIVVKDVTIPGTQHTLNGKLVDLKANNGVLLFADKAAFDATGISLFAEETLTCEAPAAAKFTCEVCNKDVLVKVQLNHVRPANAEPTVKATCETAGKYVFECSVCKKPDAEEVIPALGHDYDYTVSKVDDKYTILAKCKRNCGESEAVKTYTDLKSVVEKITPATCTKAGNTHYDVVDKDNNSFEIDTVIPKLAHTLKKADGTTVFMPAKDAQGAFITYSYAEYKDDITWFADTEFKCTNKNLSGSYICDACGESVLLKFEVEHVAADGEGKITPATCTTPAIRAAFTCKECGQEIPEAEVAPALDHDRVYSDAVKNDEGKWVISISCTRCDYTDSLTFDEEPTMTVIVPATCTSTGTTLYVGKVGEKTESITVITSKLPHKLNGKANIKSGDTIDAATPGLILFADQAPACDADETAKGHFKCEACGQDVLVNAKAAHTKPAKLLDDEEHKLAATCDHYGWIKYNCAKCGAEETEYVDALGHDLTAEVKDGKIVVKCVTEGCTATFAPIDLPAEMTKVDSKAATCGEDGFEKYTFNYTYKYTVTNHEAGKEVSKAMEKEFTDLVYVKVLKQTGHVNFVKTTDENGKEIVLVVEAEIVKGEGEDAKTYIVKYKICAECGRRILVSETVKPAEDPTV